MYFENTKDVFNLYVTKWWNLLMVNFDANDQYWKELEHQLSTEGTPLNVGKEQKIWFRIYAKL
jgi:hypothetical protein